MSIMVLHGSNQLNYNVEKTFSPKMYMYIFSSWGSAV